MRLSTIKHEVMSTHSYNKDELLKVLKEDMTYERFVEMKGKWLKRALTEWLVMGHIEEEEAKIFVDDCERAIGLLP